MMNTSRHTPNFTTLSRSVTVAGLLLISPTAHLLSQEVAVAPADLQNQPQNPTQTLSSESLQQLLAPIALYPDALIALILPASTVPSDVVLASRYFAANGDPQNIPNQSWDSSVQSLASYPQVITWMDQNLQWTTTLGQAFIAQQADVMSAIQQLRTQAQLAGNLVDTPQQRIVKQSTIIRIVPAEPDYLYVPQYDPEVVYVQPYSQDLAPLITFGVGFAVGAWLNYDCDWNRHQIYRGNWQPGWNGGGYQNGGNPGGNNTVNVVNINQSTAQPWQPTPQSSQQLVRQQQNFARINSSRPASAQTVSGVTAASSLTRPGNINSQIPRPSRTNFANSSTAKNNQEASPRSPVAPLPNAAQVNRNALQPTTPPKVSGQNGMPPVNFSTQNPNQSLKKNSTNHEPSSHMPPSPVVGQNAGNGSTVTQHAANAKPHHDTVVPQKSVPSSRSPVAPLPQAAQVNKGSFQPTTHPKVSGQNGMNQSTAPQQTASPIHHSGTVVPQTSSVAKSSQAADVPTRHQSAHPQAAPASAPAPQVQSHQQSSPANNPRPQQAAEAPKHHDVVSTPNAAPQQQRPQQQPSSGGHTQAHQPAPPPIKVSKAPPANSGPAQPSGTNPDKKKKDATQ